MTYSNYLTFVWTWFVVGLITFVVLLFKTAPYGRHTRSDWGPLINNRLGWFVMEVTVLIVLSWYLIIYNEGVTWTELFLITPFYIHYLHRGLIYPFRIRTGIKKMPLVIALMAVFFNLINGSLFGLYFTFFADYSFSWLLDSRFAAGLFIFLLGAFINIKADNYLISLRKPGETSYKIPRGWLFEYVSSPNLLGEMIEWLGYAIITWSLPGFVFFAWTCFNLIPRALAHHRWYKEKFVEYPPQRKAFIPFAW